MSVAESPNVLEVYELIDISGAMSYVDVYHILGHIKSHNVYKYCKKAVACGLMEVNKSALPVMYSMSLGWRDRLYDKKPLQDRALKNRLKAKKVEPIIRRYASVWELGVLC